MPYKNKEDRIANTRRYRELQYVKDKRKEQYKEYYHKNKEKENARAKLWRQTEYGRMRGKIASWKSMKLHIGDDIETIFHRWDNATECEWCGKEQKLIMLEHNHYSGECRGMVCRSCNTKMRWKDDRFQKVMLHITNVHN